MPRSSSISRAPTPLSLTTPAAGDGGYIYIGGNSLTEYDPTNPLDGSIIDNADISYMTRIEVQGGGIIDSVNTTPATPGAPTLPNTDWYDTLERLRRTGRLSSTRPLRSRSPIPIFPTSPTPRCSSIPIR